MGRLGMLVILLAVLATGASACSPGTAADSGGRSDSLAALQQGAVSYTLIEAQSSLPVGAGRFVFGVAPSTGEPVSGLSPQVWVGREQGSPARGPFPARWVTWTAPQTDRYGAPPVPGFYEADIVIPAPGKWSVLARATVNGRAVAARGDIPVYANPSASVGSPAIGTSTPVADSPEAAAAIDTRDPPTPMHYVSLDTALSNGLPTVLVFATPLLCESRMCGSVVDEVLDVYDHVGRTRANFVDVEIYPTRDTNRPAPAFLRWRFESEPWVLVIDRSGTVRGRFEGPVVSPEIQAALQPLLSS